MTQARSTAAYITVVDATTDRIAPSPAKQGSVARLPDGYDQTDLRMLEWIAAQRPAGAKMPDLAA